jgi:hypothetical protein
MIASTRYPMMRRHPRFGYQATQFSLRLIFYMLPAFAFRGWRRAFQTMRADINLGGTA